MLKRKCKGCLKEKNINDFYKSPNGKDGYAGKCKECAKQENKTSGGSESRVCIICGKEFKTRISEVRRGGGRCCSRECYYKRLKKIIKKGENSPYWRGGKIITSSGYITIYNPGHIRCSKSGYVFEHLLVMEKHIGRPVLKTENVHHIDGNKSNNKLNNLVLFPTMSAHMKYHWEQERKRGVNRYKK